MTLSVNLLESQIGLLSVSQQDLSINRYLVFRVLDLCDLWRDDLEMRVEIEVVAQVPALELLVLASLLSESLTQDEAAAQLRGLSLCVEEASLPQ